MRAPTVLVVLLLCGPGCLWRSYADILRIHLDVLSGVAQKAADNAQAGQRPASNEVTELTYPLQRARQFAYQYRGSGDRESYRVFVAALDRYEAFVSAIDGARGDPSRWAAERSTVSARYEEWRSAADRAGAALEREG